MKYSAVIFDLFGTLVDEPLAKDHSSMLRQISSVLSVPYDDFATLWPATSLDRGTGVFRTAEANIEYICRKLGVSIEDTQLKRASRIVFSSTESAMTPRGDAVEVLSSLKSKGSRTALISNCSLAVPVIWKDTPLAPLIDVTVFSCVAGLRKPDPRIYELAAKQLAVKPENCLYIGDGGSQELTGAASVGMHPVLIRVPYENNPAALLYSREDWHGPVISSLKEVLTLLS
jgi:putative hydrolase of the HAD superfamily